MRAAVLLCKFATIAPRPRRRPSNGLQMTFGRPRLQKIGGVRGWRGCQANYCGGGVAAGLINRSGRLAASVNVSGGRGHSAPPPPEFPLRFFRVFNQSDADREETHLRSRCLQIIDFVFEFGFTALQVKSASQQGATRRCFSVFRGQREEPVRTLDEKETTLKIYFFFCLSAAEVAAASTPTLIKSFLIN